MSQHTQGSSTPTRPNDLAKRCHVGAKPGQCNVQVDCDRTRFQAKVQPYLWSRGRTAMKTKLSSYSFPDGWPCSFHLPIAGWRRSTGHILSEAQLPFCRWRGKGKTDWTGLEIVRRRQPPFLIILVTSPKSCEFCLFVGVLPWNSLKCQKFP